MPSWKSLKSFWPKIVGAPTAYARPLVPLSLSFASGIACHHLWPGYALPAAAIVLVAGAVLVRGIRRVQGRCWIPLWLFGALGYLALTPWLPQNPANGHLRHLADGQQHVLTGTIAAAPDIAVGQRVRLILDQLSVGIGSNPHSVAGRLRLTVYGPSPVLVEGQRVQFAGRLRPLRNFQNPHGFDYRRHMAYQRVYATSWVRGDRLMVVSPAPAGQPPSLLADYRHRLRQRIAAVSHGETEAVMAALLVGDCSALTTELREVFNRCGIGHLLAISGLHIGLIAGFVYASALWALNRSRAVLSRGAGRQGAALLTVAFVIFYGLLSGLRPSTQRAVVMVAGALTGVVLRRDTDTVNFLALAALTLMIWHPPVLFSMGFQLSFSAVLCIVLGLAGCGAAQDETRRASQPGWRQRVRLFIKVSVYATVGTLPLVMYYFGRVSLIGLAANCVAIPFVGIAVLPVGMLALLLAPLSTALTESLLRLVARLLDVGLALAHHAADWQFAAWDTFQPTPIEIGIAAILIAAWLMHRRHPQLKLLIAAAVLALVIDGGWWYRHRFAHNDLRITVLDVGQGSATLIEFPGGQTLLVDGGGFPDNALFDVGERIIAPLLRRRKILTVDYLILSHPSSDHMNGLHYIVSHFRPHLLLWSGIPAETASGRAFFDLIQRKAVRTIIPESETFDMEIGGVRLAVVSPAGLPRGRRSIFSPADTNNTSLVLRLSFGNRSVLLPGDIETAAEQELVQRLGTTLQSTVLLAPHHGSRTSSSAGFIAAVRPQAVIISCGVQNAYGFPHPRVLTRYRAAGCALFRTDRNGSVSLSMTTEGIHLVCFDRTRLAL